ncbi:MAG: response regulator [Spirochaetota bacterium]
MIPAFDEKLAATKVLALEDQPVIQERLRRAFAASEKYHLLSVCSSVDEALAELAGEKPAIFLVDLELPEKSGEDLIAVLRDRYPEVKIVVFTVFEDHERIVRLMQKGIRGYLLKDISDELLFAELGVIEAGGSTLTERVAQKLIADFAAEKVLSENPLTEREQEVMNLTALGLNYKDIAEDLDISPHTVRRHINHIYEKLEVTSKVQALNRARQLGLL